MSVRHFCSSMNVDNVVVEVGALMIDESADSDVEVVKAHAEKPLPQEVPSVDHSVPGYSDLSFESESFAEGHRAKASPKKIGRSRWDRSDAPTPRTKVEVPVKHHGIIIGASLLFERFA